VLVLVLLLVARRESRRAGLSVVGGLRRACLLVLVLVLVLVARRESRRAGLSVVGGLRRTSSTVQSEPPGLALIRWITGVKWWCHF